MTKHLMICISGWAGTGKDECAGRLVRAHDAIHTGLADPGKRHMADTYGFTEQQLWGPSEYRNTGDKRYPKPKMQRLGVPSRNSGFWEIDVNRDDIETQEKIRKAGGVVLSEEQTQALPAGWGAQHYHVRCYVKDSDPNWFLSPRESLQLYLELMNTLYTDTWIRQGVDIQRKLASSPEFGYEKTRGVVRLDGTSKDRHGTFITTFSDFRHIHEHRYVKMMNCGEFVPVLVRVKRPTVTRPPFQHRSETEQTRIRDEAYDWVIDNSKTLEELYSMVDEIIAIASQPNWVGKHWTEDFILTDVQDSYRP